MNFRVLSVAELEGADAASWYDDQRSGLGDDFFDKLERAFERIRAATTTVLVGQTGLSKERVSSIAQPVGD